MTKLLALNPRALMSTELYQDPWPWGMYSGVFELHVLSAPFPEDHFEQHSQQRLLEALGKRGTAAWYQHNVKTRPLLNLGETEPFEPDGLDEPWLQVAADLTSSGYREFISEVVKHDVRRLRMQAHFWRFGEGSFFQPHVDKPHKIVTHLMYLTEGWTPEMGGCIQILGSGDCGDLHAEIPPLINTGVLLKRTDRAWHSVSRIPLGCKLERRVLQVWFWES